MTLFSDEATAVSSLYFGRYGAIIQDLSNSVVANEYGSMWLVFEFVYFQ